MKDEKIKSIAQQWTYKEENVHAYCAAIRQALSEEETETQAVLRELVDLKNIKDLQCKTEDYLKRQPVAWERARQLVAKI